MTREKQVSVRFAAVGGNATKAEMRGIGRAGREAMQTIGQSSGVAESGLDSVSASVMRTTSMLEKMAARATQSAVSLRNPLQAQINSMTGAFDSGNRAGDTLFADHMRALDNLRAKYNPMFAVIQRYKQEVMEIRAANSSQAISEDEKAAAISRSRQAALADIAVIKNRQTALQGLSRDTRVSTFHAQNLMFQFQDIGMMMVSGQAPFILAAQQGTQFAGILQQIRDQGQSVFKGIIGGLTRMISPMSLLTIGLIGGAAALVQWGMRALGAKDDGDDFEKTLGNLKTASRELKDSLEKFTSPFSKLREEFGQNTEQARALYGVLIQLQRLEALDKQADAAAMLGEEFEDLIWMLARIDSVDRVFDDMVVLRQVRNLGKQFGVTEAEARRLQSTLEDIDSADSAEERNAAMQRMLDIIMSVKDESGQIPDALRPIAIEVAKAVKEGLVLSNTFDLIDDKTGDIKTGLSGVIGELGIAVGRARELRDALASAASASLSRRDQIAVLRSQIGAASRGESVSGAEAAAETALNLGRSGATVDQIAAAALRASEEATTLESLRAELSDLTNPDKGRGGKGAAGEKDKILGIVDALRQQLTVLRETDPIKKKMLEYSEQLTGATDQERAMVQALVETLDRAKNGWEAVSLSLKEYAEDAKRIGDDIGNVLVGAFSAAEDAVAEFVKTGKLSFSDLVTSIIADLAKLATRHFITGPLSAALGNVLDGLGGGLGSGIKSGPGIGFKVKAKFEGGGHTGYGARTGGLDGQGGFLAMVHPQERIYDEARGQRGPAQTSGPTIINFNGVRDMESFRQSRSQVAADLQRGLSTGRRTM